MLEGATSAKLLPGEVATAPPPVLSRMMLVMVLGTVPTAVGAPNVPPPPPLTAPADVMPFWVPVGWVGSVTV